MPIHEIKTLSEGTILALWKIKESKAELQEMLNHLIHDVSKTLNQRESAGIHWLASRVLLQEIFLEQKVHIHKNEFNKPRLEIDGKKYFVSITHSHDFAGVMVSDKHEVGLDIEKIDERINRVAHKFINEDENKFIVNEKAVLYKTLTWSAKEAMYKVYGLKELDFKENMTVLPFELQNQGFFEGRI